MFMIILRVFHNSLLFGFEETKGLYSLTCIRSEYNTNSSVVYNRIINDCLEVMCVRYKTECIQLNYCEYQVLSPRSYGLIVTIILQVHPGSSGALWGYPRCWPPSVELRVQPTSVCLHTSLLTKRFTCCGTTVPHQQNLLNRNTLPGIHTHNSSHNCSLLIYSQRK